MVVPQEAKHPYNISLVTPFPRTYPSALMFTAPLFLTDKKASNPNALQLVNEKAICDKTDTMTWYLAMQRNELFIYITTQRKVKCILQNERSQTKKGYRKSNNWSTTE